MPPPGMTMLSRSKNTFRARMLTTSSTATTGQQTARNFFSGDLRFCFFFMPHHPLKLLVMGRLKLASQSRTAEVVSLMQSMRGAVPAMVPLPT